MIVKELPWHAFKEGCWSVLSCCRTSNIQTELSCDLHISFHKRGGEGEEIRKERKNNLGDTTTRQIDFDGVRLEVWKVFKSTDQNWWRTETPWLLHLTTRRRYGVYDEAIVASCKSHLPHTKLKLSKWNADQTITCMLWDTNKQSPTLWDVARGS